MVLTITCLLALVSFIITLLAALGKAPLWVAVLLISIALMLTCVPLR